MARRLGLPVPAGVAASAAGPKKSVMTRRIRCAKLALAGALAATLCATIGQSGDARAQAIQHDAEHYVLQRQHGEKWAAADKKVDKILADVRKKNGGKRPNIIYILVDDMGFGEFGIPELNMVRGYRTPNINKLAAGGLSFARMYTEPSCTPTRAAFLTGRLPVRSQMFDTKIVPPENTGLHGDEVTIAEILSKAGYNTVHIGKWHQGDIEQSAPHNQGFDVANYPLHNQASFTLMTGDAEIEGWAINVAPRRNDPSYRLDANFRPRGWVLGVEAKKGGKAYEWGVKAGDKVGIEYYNKLNDRYKVQVIEQLRRLAKEAKPFFLNYWPQIPINFSRMGRKFRTANGGAWVESMAELDDNIGEIMAEVKRLGIAGNTLVIVMGDNGPMMAARPRSGFSDLVFRGGKGDATEGGIRVSAFFHWPGVIKARSYAGDMVHVSDLYTTLARIAQATKHIPRDRIIDGVDQTALLLLGDGNGRRDYIHTNVGPAYIATIKENLKIHWAAGGAQVFGLKIYDLYRDPRESSPLKTEVTWAMSYFGAMRARHMAFKKRFPDRVGETKGVLYGGIANLRPETKALMKAFFKSQELLKAN